MESSPLDNRLTDFFGRLDGAVAQSRRSLASQAEALRDRLRHFFAGLKPAIDVAHSAQAELDRRLATQFSIFDDFLHFIHKKENTLSLIFRNLLDPKGNHGQGRPFLDALLDEIRESMDHAKRRSGVDDQGARSIEMPSAHVDCRLYTEYGFVKKFTNKGDRGSIDIVIEWPASKYWIGIENKPWAGEQKEQIKEYFAALLDKVPSGPATATDKVLILYFSGKGTDPTTAPEEIEKRARCITMPYRVTPYAPSVEGWLRRCRATCEAERIRWFLAELEDYIQKDVRFRSESELEHRQEESNDEEHST